MPSVLVFDMGGVLYDFRGDRLIAETSRRRRRWRSEEVQRRWVPLVKSFETGACGEAEFAEAVLQHFDLALTSAEFLLSFRAAASGFYAGALALMGELAARHRLVSLSNTNGVQWPKLLEDLGDRDPFHAHRPSHLSGFHKPDKRAFESIAAAYAVETQFYFFDDRADNVAVAQQLGWHARRVRGVAEARQACRELGLLER
jgi:glucose-1-phosphatase